MSIPEFLDDPVGAPSLDAANALSLDFEMEDLGFTPDFDEPEAELTVVFGVHVDDIEE